MNHKTHRGTVSVTCSRLRRQEAGMEAANRIDAQVRGYFVDVGELSLVDLLLRSLSCHGCVQTADAHHWMDAQRVGPHLPRSARPSVLVTEPFTGAPRLSFPTCNISTFFFFLTFFTGCSRVCSTHFQLIHISFQIAPHR